MTSKPGVYCVAAHLDRPAPPRAAGPDDDHRNESGNPGELSSDQLTPSPPMMARDD
jgi:hypothetical protein